MRKILMVVFGILLVKSAFAQIQQDHVKSTRSVAPSGKVSAIPDPHSALAIAAFAQNPSVAKELDLTGSELAELTKLLHKNRGSLSAIVVNGVGDDGRPISPDQVRSQIIARRSENEQAINEILSPEKLARLKQLVFQIEIARLGFGEAITNGFLATEVGVHENQKSNIVEKATQIEAKLDDAIRKLLLEASGELLSELTPEQREKAKRAIGNVFLFKEYTAHRVAN